MNFDGKKKWFKASVIFTGIGAGLFLFAGGIVFGMWFMANFQIVPRGDMGKMVKDVLEKSPELAKLTGADGKDVAKALDSVLGSNASAVKDLAQQVLKSQPAAGPFTFRFKPGERLGYTFTASMTGQGNEGKTTSPVTFDLGSKFDLVTESVDGAGNGVVRMAFNGTTLQGNMMGSPFTLTQSPGAGASSGQVDDKLAMPLLGFLNTPVRMSVAPNGATRELPDPARPNPLVEELPMLTAIEFPSSDMQPGTQWESYVKMSVPGASTPMRVRLLNTFTGYKTIGPRLCAVIDQKVSSEQTPSAPASAGEAIGMFLGVKPPQIDLSGGNTVYFDTDNGQLVHSEMNLGMHVDIASSLGAAEQVLKGLGANLENLLGDASAPQQRAPSAEEPPNPLDLNMNITGAVSLVDASEPAQPAASFPQK